MEENRLIELKESHWQAYTSIIIDAPFSEVWKVLTDWRNISNWSSSLKSIEGEISNGGKVTVSYFVDGKIYKTDHNFILIENKEFGWSDPMEGGFKGLIDNHRFRVESVSDNKTLFIQSDDFEGEGDEKITSKELANQVIDFFPIFNRELKQEVEKD